MEDLENVGEAQRFVPKKYFTLKVKLQFNKYITYQNEYNSNLPWNVDQLC